MTSSSETTEVAPGQVYRDLDPRSRGRTIRVDRVIGDYAYVTDSNGRRTRILVRRLQRRASNGYELIQSGDKEHPC